MKQSMKWFVVRTVPGQQQRAMAEFAEVGIEAFCPMMRRETRHHQTKRWIMREFPLFTGYAFIRLVEGAYDRLHGLDYTSAILGGTVGPIAIPDSQVEAFQEEQARGAFDILRPPPMAAIKPQSRVYIQSGLLSGHYASVTQTKGKKVVRAIIESFAEMREIDLDIANLQLVA